MGRRKKVVVDPYKFDTSLRYRMPMLPLGEKNRIYKNEVPNIWCNIEQDDKNSVKAFAEGYQDKWFEGQYFRWLLDTGYVKKEDAK